MTPLITLGLLAGVPLALALLARVSAVYLFVSILAGSLLAQYLSDDVVVVLELFRKSGNPLIAVRLALVVLPVVLTLIFLRKTLKASRLLLELLPLLLCIGMLVVIVLPLLPLSLGAQVTATPYGKVLDTSHDALIGATILCNLSLMWLTSRQKHNEHGRRGKH
jgi:hypothetical protein